MTKKTLSLLASLITAILLIPTLSAHAGKAPDRSTIKPLPYKVCMAKEPGSILVADGLLFTVNSDGSTLTCTGYVDADLENLVIPGKVTVDGTEYSVTIIGEDAFCNNMDINTVTIGEGVTTIKNNAFGNCLYILKVVLPTTLTDISDGDLFKDGGPIDIYCWAQNPPAASDTTFGDIVVKYFGKVYVPCQEAADSYAEAEGWKRLQGHFEANPSGYNAYLENNGLNPGQNPDPDPDPDPVGVTTEVVENCQGAPEYYVSDYYYSWGQDWMYSNDFAARVSFGPDNKVYVNDLLPIVQVGWLVGELDDNGIVTFKGVQMVDNYDASNRSFYICAVKQIGENQVEIVNEYQFKISEDRTELRLITEGIWLAAIDNNFDVYQFQSGHILTLLKDNPIIPPAQIAQHPYSYTCLVDGNYENVDQISMALDDNTGKVYIKGLVYYIQGWVEGTYDGKDFIFPSDQFQGLSRGKLTYFYSGVRSGNDGREFTDNLVLHYDAESGAITCDEDAIVLGGSSRYDDSLLYLSDLSFTKIKEGPATPANPEDLGINEYIELFQFILPAIDTEGNPIVEDNLYYRIYLDDELFTFTTSDYPGLAADTDLICAKYTLFDKETAEPLIGRFGDYHVVVLPEYEKVGVQAVYDWNGESRTSDIITFPETGSVNNVDGSDAVVRRTYWSITGLQLPAPADGLTIVREVLSNGSVKTRKVTARHK